LATIYFSGDITSSNSGSAKYFRLLSEHMSGHLVSVGTPIETITGFFLWRVEGIIVRPRLVDKVLFFYLRTNFPKIYEKLLTYGPSFLAQRKFGPNHEYKGNLAASPIVIAGFMPFRIVQHLKPVITVEKYLLTVPFFHANDRTHQKLKRNIKAADGIATLSAGEFPASGGRELIALGASLEDSWFQNLKRCNLGRTKLRVIWIGRNEPSKGAADFEKVAKICSNANIDFVAAGPGTEYFKGPITGLGRLADKDLLNLYDSADLLIHTGLHECFSYVVAQALARQLPVICLKGNFATSSLVEESRGGLIVEDINAMADSINVILEDRIGRESFGINGYQWALTNLTKDAFKARLEDFLSSSAISDLGRDQPSL